MPVVHPRTALITGASSGLGTARGWKGAVGARREGRLAEAVQKVRTQGTAEVHAAVLNVTDDATRGRGRT